MKILIAEDDSVSRLRLRTSLISWGYEVQAVEDGIQAFQILGGADSPRLAILDRIMPRMDGLEVVRKVREHSASEPIYIILLTSQDGREDTIQGLEAGADEYVIKPYNPRELRARIKAGERVLELQTALSRRVGDLECALNARRQAEEALRKSDERSRMLFTTIPHPIWVYDLQTLEFLEVNDAAISHYGYSRGEFLRMNITDIRLPEDVPRLKADLKKIRLHEKKSSHWKHRLKDGRIIEVQISSHTIDFAGREAVLVVAQDITEQKRLEVELRHSQKLEAVGSLAAGIAHELNTPIQFVGDNLRFLEGAFAGLGELIGSYQDMKNAAAAGELDARLLDGVRQAEETADLDYLRDEVPKAVRQSLDGIERVATIVRAMKDFAHPDHGERTAADLNRALESTLTVARNELKYVADVETDFRELPPVPCRLGDLNQVFLNLLVNAAHAIRDVVKDTGKRGRIRVTTRQDGAHVKIAISDTGCGIPPEIREKIFDPFFTTKEVGRGTGQGLAIARSIIVEKHGGTLTFESEVDRGSTFVVRLPLGTATAAQETVRL